MASYTPLLRFVEPANGDLAWGGTVNAGFTELADAAIAGTATVSVTASDQTLTPADGAADDARKMILNITGTPGVARTVYVPATSKVYFIKNGANAVVTVKVSGQTGVSLPAGASIIARVNGTDVVQAVSYFTFSTLDTPTVEAGTFTKGYTEQVASANTGAAYSIDLTTGSIQILTLTANCTFTFPTATAGKSFMLFLKQDAIGSRTATWPGSILWPAGAAPVLTTTATKTDRFVFTADGTYWYGTNAGQNY